MTLQEAKDQVARNHSFTDWSHVLKAHSGRLDYFINEAMKAAISEACREQRENCAARYDDGQPVGEHYSSIRGSIKNAPEPILT